MSAFNEEVLEATANALSRPLKYMYNLFVSHPKENHMTYLEHLCHSAHLSYQMGYGSVCLMIHAVFPFVCKTKGSGMIKKLYTESHKIRDDVKDIM